MNVEILEAGLPTEQLPFVPLNETGMRTLQDVFAVDQRLLLLSETAGAQLGDKVTSLYAEEAVGLQTRDVERNAAAFKCHVQGASVEAVAREFFSGSEWRARNALSAVTQSVGKRHANYSGDFLGEIVVEVADELGEEDERVTGILIRAQTIQELRKLAREHLLVVEGSDQELTWRDAALCLGVDSNKLFFPRSGEDDSRAKRICGACAVRAECLDDSIVLEGSWPGIRAGTDEEERHKIKRARYSRQAREDAKQNATAGVSDEGARESREVA